MIRGLYTAASSMLAANERQTAAANNIANIGTYGYKAEQTSNLAFEQLLVRRVNGDGVTPYRPPSVTTIGSVGTGTGLSTSRPDLSQGPLVQTRNPLDLALSGQGFFVLQSPAGTVLTRDGHFGLDADGRLVNGEGALVLGEGGPITLGAGDIAVAADGTISLDGRAVDRLQIQSFAADNLVRVGDTSFAAAEGAAGEEPAATVTQGALESANVDAAMVMTDMLKVSSAFQSAQKVFQTLDGTLGKIVNDVARF